MPITLCGCLGFPFRSGYQFKVGAYAQINCPAISSSEWHPFSLFPVPGPGSRAGVHIEAVSETPVVTRLDIPYLEHIFFMGEGNKKKLALGPIF